MTHRGPFQPLRFCDSVIWGEAEVHLLIVSESNSKSKQKWKSWVCICCLPELLFHLSNIFKLMDFPITWQGNN